MLAATQWPCRHAQWLCRRPAPLYNGATLATRYGGVPLSEFVKAARVGELQPGEMKLVEAMPTPVLLVNYDGRVLRGGRNLPPRGRASL